MKKRLSIRSELALFCTAIILLSMAFQIIFNLYFARSMAIWEKEQQIDTLFATLISNYTDDPDMIRTITQTAETDMNIKIQISSEDGVIYNSGAPDNVRKPSTKYPLEQPYPHDIHPYAETDKDTVRLEESILYNGQVRTFVIMSSVAAIDASVNLFTRSNIMVSCAVILLSVVAVLIFSRRFTKPIENMERVAKNMANYQFDQKANESVHTQELQSLSVSINTMSAKLHTFIDQLETDNASLTSKVEYQQQMEQMRRQFIANISHEMKIPLSMLMMYSESLKADIPNIDRNFYYDTIIQEAAGLNTMVEQLLDTSSIENGLIQLEPVSIDLSAFTQQIVEKMSPILNPFSFTQSIETNVTILGDQKYLGQAITNYLNNAIAHTAEGDAIALSLAVIDSRATLTVTNQGNPIAEEDLPYIWDSFYRGDKSRTTKNQKRVGLGLYIVKTCIDAHGGTVAVQNGGDDVSFSLSIPIQ